MLYQYRTNINTLVILVGYTYRVQEPPDRHLAHSTTNIPMQLPKFHPRVPDPLSARMNGILQFKFVVTRWFLQTFAHPATSVLCRGMYEILWRYDGHAYNENLFPSILDCGWQHSREMGPAFNRFSPHISRDDVRQQKWIEINMLFKKMGYMRPYYSTVTLIITWFDFLSIGSLGANFGG